MAEYVWSQEQSRNPGSWRSGPSWPPESNMENSVCRYFIRGNCMYGSRCRFLHTEGNEAPGPAIAGPSGSSGPPVPCEWGDQIQDNTGTLNDQQEPQSGSGNRIPDHDHDDWANAPEFIPSKDHAIGAPKSYAQVLNNEATTSNMSEERAFEIPLCPLMEKNLECKYGKNCMYIHGDMCDVCGRCSLHPTDSQQRKKHHSECLSQTERKMEVSQAISRSYDKSCGICFEVIMEKSSREQRFGILPNCNHCFCLTCIRKWRQAKQFENKIIRACPECRTTSDFVCPSMYWVHTKEEKETLIKDYKEALSVKDCKYFNVGRGKCPFGNKCFYRHAFPDGTKADVGPPLRQRRQNSDGEYGVLQQIILWDFLDERDNHWLFSNLDDLEDLVAIMSDDSEDSDWSDFDIIFE